MKKIRLFPLLFSLLLLISLCLPVRAVEMPEQTQPAVSGLTGSSLGMDAQSPLSPGNPLNLNVKAALLYEISSGTMVYGYNIDTKLYPASLTKIMTCLTALETGNLTDMVTVTDTALVGMHPDGSNVGLAPGEEISMEDLLYCVMLASANDACAVIAEHIAGTEAGFVEMMNAKAQALGCTGTHFVNSHGLHDDGHYTTARDLLKIFSAALEHDFFRELYASTYYVVPATNLHGARELTTTVYMRSKDVTPDYYDSRVEGGKTGFTTPAGRCFVCSAKDGDLHYISVIMGSENEFLDNGAAVHHNFIDTETLLDCGFSDFAYRDALSPLSPIGQVQVSLSPDLATVAPSETARALLPKEIDPQDIEIGYSLIEPTLTAPLEAGLEIGTAEAYYKGSCVARAPLRTANAVRENAIVFPPVRSAPLLSGSPWKTVMLLLAVLLATFLLLFARAAILRRKSRRSARRRARRRL